jgi:hypothetical protein
MTLACQTTTLPHSIKNDAGRPVPSVEEYHKSLKQNAAIAKSPSRTLRTQSNHIFASMMACVKLEKLKFASKLNHFAMKSKIYLAATKAAFNEIIALKQNAMSA